MVATTLFAGGDHWSSAPRLVANRRCLRPGYVAAEVGRRDGTQARDVSRNDGSRAQFLSIPKANGGERNRAIFR
jgi:hypothetical protein